MGSAWGLAFLRSGGRRGAGGWLAGWSRRMAKEAERALGQSGLEALPDRALEAEPDLIRRSTPGFRAFAQLL